MKTHETNLQILLNFKGWCYLSTIFRNNIIYKISDREGVVHLKFGGMEWFIWDLLAGGRGWGWLIWDLCDFTENYTLSRDGGNLFEISSYFRLKIAQSKQIQGGRWFVIRLKPPHLPSQNLKKKRLVWVVYQSGTLFSKFRMQKMYAKTTKSNWILRKIIEVVWPAINEHGLLTFKSKNEV